MVFGCCFILLLYPVLLINCKGMILIYAGKGIARDAGLCIVYI